MKKTAVSLLIVLSSSQVSFASEERRAYPDVYPFVPFETSDIYSRVKNLSEDPHFVRNVHDMQKKRLFNGRAKDQPWTSTYWPLNKGLVADDYSSRINIFRLREELSWNKNYNNYLARKEKVHTKINELSEKDLETLAPSEKYDLLLGDPTFHLTNTLWDYTYKWGSNKEMSFVSSVSVVDGLVNALLASGEYTSEVEARSFAESDAQNYVLERKNSRMALWEGICHGWATASGHIPRPKRTVTFTLDDGRKLKFYPDDIKGLVSLMWANSVIQDYKSYDQNGVNVGGGVVMEGLRCNRKSPAKDQWGRFYDNKPDPRTGKIEPRCVGIHPAVWHLALVNVMGAQQRSFVVERKIKAAVDNHPMASYKMEFFNPQKGKDGSLQSSIISRSSYKNDPFEDFRNPEATHIVGVKTKMVYVDWERPDRREYDGPNHDKLEEKEMLYDLELNAKGDVVGGQWRVSERSKPVLGRMSTRAQRQPDFIWVVTKDWKRFFPQMNLAPWKDTKRTPPAEWKFTAFNAHSFVYQQTREFNWDLECTMYHLENGNAIDVPCEFKVSRPQPLINVIDKLVELAK